MNKTTIEWTDYTWNPVTGCTKVSQGCKNCYAETMANRFWGDRKFTDVQIHEDRLLEPINSEGKLLGKRVFVCDVSDLFHESITFTFILRVFRIAELCNKTIFQFLTKRPQRALEFFQWAPYQIKFDNIWLGTSCEDQATANERIPLLLQIPAAVRFLSCEPLLGPIDLTKVMLHPNDLYSYNVLASHYNSFSEPTKRKPKIDWVIAGGESGHGARPMHPDWVRSLRDQCASANVPFFFKQWGEWVDNQNMPREYVSGNYKQHVFDDNTVSAVEVWKIGKSKSGNILDGKQHLKFPKP